MGNDSDRRLTPGVIAAGVFTAAYAVPAIVGAVVTGNGEFIYYGIVLGLLIAAVAGLHWRIGLSAGLLWALAVWGALHMAGGLVPVPEGWPINGDVRVLYSWWIIPIGDGSGGEGIGQGGWLKFDNLVHAYGFGVATWLCWQGLVSMLGERREGTLPGFGGAVLAALAGLGLGAANEIVEFAAAMTMHANVGGYVNTGWDLVCNSIGATIAAGVLWGMSRWGRRRDRGGRGDGSPRSLRQRGA